MVYANNRKATIHDAALWSWELLKAKRAMLVFVFVLTLMLLDGLNETVQVDKGVRLAADLMPSSTEFFLANSISDGARRVHWSSSRDRRTSRMNAEKDRGASCMEGLCLVSKGIRKTVHAARSRNSITDVPIMSMQSDSLLIFVHVRPDSSRTPTLICRPTLGGSFSFGANPQQHQQLRAI